MNCRTLVVANFSETEMRALIAARVASGLMAGLSLGPSVSAIIGREGIHRILPVRPSEEESLAL
jgi:LytS/YehU family sensor histidine kinase